MDPNIPATEDAGLRFFSKMSAANSHEIKNALAIINENAGLLADLVAMSEQGIAIEPERLKRLAQKIQEQVSRADEIAKSTNRFAHSLDNPHGPADLEQSLILIKTMAMRFATQRHIGIEIIPSASSITLPSQPFRLQHLLWLCLRCAMEATNAERTIQVGIERSDSQTAVRFGPLSHLEPSTVTELSATTQRIGLLQSVKGIITADLEKEELVITFMKSPDG